MSPVRASVFLRGPVVSMVTILSLEPPCRKLGLVAKGLSTPVTMVTTLSPCHHSDCQPGRHYHLLSSQVSTLVPLTLTKEQSPLCLRTKRTEKVSLAASLALCTGDG